LHVLDDSNTVFNIRFIRRSALINKLALHAAAILCLMAHNAIAQSTGPFPAGAVDARTIAVQEKVEALFEAKEYKRALFIYEHELAPLGDKYAQYMVGFMNLTGTGVAENPVVASAWYRLAAERANPEFLTVRDQLVDSLSDIDRGRSDQLYLQLRQRYSDVAILLRLIKEDLDSMTARTGSRVVGASGQVMIVDPRTGFGVSGDNISRQVRRRLKMRLEFVTQAIGQPDLDTDIDKVDINELEASVGAYVSRLNDQPQSGVQADR